MDIPNSFHGHLVDSFRGGDENFTGPAGQFLNPPIVRSTKGVSSKNNCYMLCGALEVHMSILEKWSDEFTFRTLTQAKSQKVVCRGGCKPRRFKAHGKFCIRIFMHTNMHTLKVYICRTRSRYPGECTGVQTHDSVGWRETVLWVGICAVGIAYETSWWRWSTWIVSVGPLICRGHWLSLP